MARTTTKTKIPAPKKTKVKAAAPVIAEAVPLKLDLGCGKNKQPGHRGVDILEFEGVDVVVNLGEEHWPFADNSVDEVHSSHFVEHLTQTQRVHFWNELYRVMKVGAVARIIVPHWTNACAYGDPTHQWPPISDWTIYYLHKAWREVNAPHVDVEGAALRLTCDFDHVIGGTWTPELESRNMETRVFWMSHYTNSFRDMIATLTKRG